MTRANTTEKVIGVIMNSAIRRGARCDALVSAVSQRPAIRLHNLFGSLMATVMLAAFALPADAGSGSTKTISFSASPAALTKTTTVVYATITNTGNSTANSFEVDWSTSSGLNVVSATASGCGTVYPTPPGLKGAGYSRVVSIGSCR